MEQKDAVKGDDELFTVACCHCSTGIIGIIPGDSKERKMIVINVIEENTGIIRIISSYYADVINHKKFIDKYNRNKKRKQEYQKLGFLQGNILSDAKLIHLKKLLEK
jgi:hypothetical protein